MLIKRTLPLLSIMLLLAGCFRQAEDTFDSVGSQNSQTIGITQQPLDEPTEAVTLIVPDSSAQTVDEGDASSTPRVVPATATEVDADAQTIPTNTPLSVPTATLVIASETPQVIPTATEATFVTPGFNEEVAQPTATPTEEVEGTVLDPTPTAPGDIAVVVGDCEYEVQNGDNLFRIALNNDVTLDSLLSANGLSEASVIQPGQILDIPNCDGDSTSTTAVEDGEDEEEDEPIVLDDCDIEIADGDTLFGIALENDITLAELLEENELTENSVIQPGQIITLPNCEDGDSLEADSTDSVIEATEEADSDQVIHTVVAGDTLLTIARQYGVTANSINQVNTIPNPNNLTVGQQLIIPIPAD